MNDFSFIIQADETSVLELQLGRFIPTAAPQVAALTGPQGPNVVLSGPASGTASAPPSYRQLVNADLVSVTLPVLNGGTGANNASGARTNLGLGTAAVQNVGAFAQTANNLSDLANAGTARTNLGLGTAATQNIAAFLQPANNLSDVGSAATARTNLGLGTAATFNTGTSGATIPLLNAANTWALLQTFTVRPAFNGATPWDSANLNFATPPAIGGTTPAAGAFTTLSASGTVSGSGFSNYLASPPAIGGTTAAAGTFTTLTATTGVEVGSTTVAGTPTVDLHSSGSANDYDARISATGGTSGTVGNADLTVAGGTISLVPRAQTGMKLDASGRMLVGTTNTDPAVNHIDGLAYRPLGGISVFAASSNPALSLGAANTSLTAFYNGAGTAVGSITTNGSSVAYNTTSDYRIKENLVPIVGALDRALSIPVYRGNFTTDPDKVTVDMMLAHEIQTVVPEAVSGAKDAVEVLPVYRDGYDPANIQPDDIVGTTEVIVTQKVDYSKLVPMLLASIHELNAKVAALEAKAS
ncbi:hypothetical protein [Paraburkholderia sp. 22B1P]|uniref:hypothetical protein n=1 Tax=Paraburkholderia sp. 22B1P TaxID=3080498 RepID=UPI00308CE7F9|nr:hypothetical protein PBP221_16990 [Paraburkholderia sp. 22B1P]